MQICDPEDSDLLVKSNETLSKAKGISAIVIHDTSSLSLKISFYVQINSAVLGPQQGGQQQADKPSLGYDFTEVMLVWQRDEYDPVSHTKLSSSTKRSTSVLEDFSGQESSPSSPLPLFLYLWPPTGSTKVKEVALPSVWTCPRGLWSSIPAEVVPWLKSCFLFHFHCDNQVLRIRLCLEVASNYTLFFFCCCSLWA